MIKIVPPAVGGPFDAFELKVCEAARPTVCISPTVQCTPAQVDGCMVGGLEAGTEVRHRGCCNVCALVAESPACKVEGVLDACAACPGCMSVDACREPLPALPQPAPAVCCVSECHQGHAARGRRDCYLLHPALPVSRGCAGLGWWAGSSCCQAAPARLAMHGAYRTTPTAHLPTSLLPAPSPCVCAGPLK